MKTFKELYSYREMIFGMVRRDLRGRYKASILGFLWTFVNPLLQLVVYTIVFSTFLRFDIDKYYIFLFVGLVPWNFFGGCVSSGCACVIANKEMVKKIYFPREVLPISFVLTNFVNMLLVFIVIFAVLAVTGFGFNFAALLYLPLVMVIELLMATGVTMINSALTVYFRDLEHILGIITMLWMYLTPVFYLMEQIPEKYRSILYINPMTSIIQAYRQILYYKVLPDTGTLLNAVLFGIGTLIFGGFVFGRLKKHFAEEL